MSNGDNFARSTMDDTIKPYETIGFPRTTYFDEETEDNIADLRSVLDSYIDAEVAKFITGKRAIAEFDAFREELKGLGIEELQTIYSDYFNLVK